MNLPNFLFQHLDEERRMRGEAIGILLHEVYRLNPSFFKENEKFLTTMQELLSAKDYQEFLDAANSLGEHN